MHFSVNSGQSSGVGGGESLLCQLEMLRLKMILRQLQISSFGGKMNALNEVNRVITTVSYQNQQGDQKYLINLTTNIKHNVSLLTLIGQQSGSLQRPGHGNANSSAGDSIVSSGGVGDEDFLTADRMALWLKENRVLQIVLKDSLHQPQYVEKLEKVIRFSIKAGSLSLQDLHDIWNAQIDQHEAIVKNVHDLLAKLAWDFSPEQLDHLFECFQKSWSTANVKQREKLLELIRRLAEDDKVSV